MKLFKKLTVLMLVSFIATGALASRHGRQSIKSRLAQIECKPKGGDGIANAVGIAGQGY